MIVRLAMVVALALISLAPAYAADDEQGKECLLSCQAKLKRDGLWNSVRRGYCRRQCDYWVGAPPDAPRK